MGNVKKLTPETVNFIWGETRDFYVPPLLIKLVEAKDDLSIQVHPDTDYAKKVEGKPNGKNEFWYITGAEENATIYYGFNKDLTKENIKSCLEDGSICNHLNLVKVNEGDGFYVKAGTVHAIRGGVKILEIQEISDLTYRFYDYNRLQNGKPRELHIEKSLDVVTVDKTEIPKQCKDLTYKDGYKFREIASEFFFTASEILVEKSFEIAGKTLVYAVDGGGEFSGGERINKGDLFLCEGANELISNSLKIVEIKAK